jgi:hypothetical protein
MQPSTASLPVLEQVAGFTVTILAGDNDGDGMVSMMASGY